MNELLITKDSLKNKIHTIRGVQVMLDRDLALLYEVETRALKQAVKRNTKRFPSDFMFILNDDEIKALVSQSVIPSKKHLGGAKPYAFTEQGVSNLANVLSSEKSIQINILIMRAFVSMRKFLQKNAEIFTRIESVEKKQLVFELKTEKNFNKVFNALQTQKPKQGIFYDGQVFDAYAFVCDLVKSAKEDIVLIDNYIDENTLTLLSKRKPTVPARIYTNNISKQLKLDLEKHNSQYPPIEINKFKDSHDRFLILDSITVYHFGASLKDLGKKWFAFSKFDTQALELLHKLF